ncbi:Lot5p TDEL_0E00890 [Torulaspora delbrueckii]|mgnify:CR=1 FL=1|uniref:Protein LOT5 n=1 Tax=Torulaspora delbrueckii TaxID=4950 RepID=G8ZUN8_TORDE|nr:hypothetical protein TDEL_0E00890 [Torulaspora delbrueckii]CCE92332.1 hypothetical protein TDEL_0E00890 [Torulaspora delbrueckii]
MDEEDKPSCQLVYVKPTVENTIAYNRFKRTQPLINGVPMINVPSNDLLVLFGGGRDIELRTLQDPQTIIASIDLFVLNNAILLWFDNQNCGIAVPYDSIIYHGSLKSSQEREGHQLALILTLERDPLLDKLIVSPQSQECTAPSLELTLRPAYSLYDRHYNAEIDMLFSFEDFGVNRGDELINNCNQAIATCLEIYNAEPDNEEDEADENGADQEEMAFDL